MRKSRLRAITTRYKNHSFRSRLEARFAVYFDHLGIKWEYEPEGFELGNGLRYLPDFWLPEWRIWVEIKPDTPDAAGFEKAKRLALGHSAVLVLSGLPKAEPCRNNLFFGWDDQNGCCGVQPGAPAGFVAGVPAGFFAHFKGRLHLEMYRAYSQDYYPVENVDGQVVPIPSFDDDYKVDWSRAEDAVAAALSARFEFGQEGA